MRMRGNHRGAVYLYKHICTLEEREGGRESSKDAWREVEEGKTKQRQRRGGGSCNSGKNTEEHWRERSRLML